MSRIHEALKRAEQDRTAYQAVHPEPVVNGYAPEMAAATIPFETNGTPHSQAPATPITYEELVARCPLEQWRPDPTTMLFFGAQEGVLGTDEFRTLRSRLYQLREQRPLRKILITSSMPQEGKSFVAANLAQALVRQEGCKALLIDADLRASHLHSSLGTRSTPGLAEYLLGENSEVDVMQRGQMENLFFIPGGRAVSNPTELAANSRLKLLLHRVQPLFDWIILDAPPAVPVSDASLLAKECDGVLMVVRSHFTPADVANKARQEFSDKMLIGAVLNGTDPASRPEYGSRGEHSLAVS